jgi:hypothetical protein
MAVNDATRSNDPGFQHLSCSNIDIAEGLTLENHIFLVSQLPCCAQLALPYWAKITGWIINSKSEEMLLTITATVFDKDGLALANYTDVMALDGGQKGEFEVRLVEYCGKATTYSLAIKETEQF